MSTLYLCGAGNPSGVRLAININTMSKRWQNIVILDDDPSRHNSEILGCKIEGPIDLLTHASRNDDAVANLVASSTRVRQQVKQRITHFGIPFARLIDPSVDTLGVTFFGSDITVYENAVLGANATLYDGCVVFMNAIVGHGATMRRGSILGPGGILNARVILGEHAYFGSNASVLPDIYIGAFATVGSNSSLVHHLPAHASAIGVPAQIIKSKMIEKSEAPAISSDTTSEPGPALQALTRKGPPQDEASISAAVTQLWLEVLGIPSCHRSDNFFELGGSSRLALELTERIRSETSLNVDFLDVFTYPQLRALVTHYQSQAALTPSALLEPRQRGQARALARAHAREWSRQHPHSR